MKRFCLLLALASSMFSAFAYDVEVDGIYYNLNSANKTAEVTYERCDESLEYYYSPYKDNVVIPYNITVGNGVKYTVTSIGDYAFDGRSGLTSVALPNSIVSIGYKSFNYCIKLETINLPNSLRTIERNAFRDCARLTSIYLPNSVSKISYGAFRNCYFQKDSFINESSCTSEDNWGATFFDYDTEDGLIIAGDTIIKCREEATSVSIPSAITTIGTLAFRECFRISSIYIPNTVNEILGSAFYEAGIRTITLPASINNIRGLFEYSALESIIVPNSVNSIGSSSFRNCYNLKEVVIPSVINNIENESFFNCISLEHFYCPVKSVPETNPTAFDYANIEKATLHVLPGCKDFYASAEPWCRFGTIVEDCMLGDVNNDGTIDNKDVQDLRLYILTGEKSLSWNTSNANVNGDGALDVADVLMLEALLRQ